MTEIKVELNAVQTQMLKYLLERRVRLLIIGLPAVIACWFYTCAGFVPILYETHFTYADYHFEAEKVEELDWTFGTA